MDAIECILKRASVRKYQDRPVERELIEKLLLCGFHAPTAGNSRAWQFVVVQNRDTLARMSLAAPGHACLKGASLAIVACVDWKRTSAPFTTTASMEWRLPARTSCWPPMALGWAAYGLPAIPGPR